MFPVIKTELSGKTVYGPVLKTTQLSEHAQNHASPELCRKSFTMIFLGDHDITSRLAKLSATVKSCTFRVVVALLSATEASH